jgi:hypothetical protein
MIVACHCREVSGRAHSLRLIAIKSVVFTGQIVAFHSSPIPRPRPGLRLSAGEEGSSILAEPRCRLCTSLAFHRVNLRGGLELTPAKFIPRIVSQNAVWSSKVP